MHPPDHKIRWGVLGYARIARESVIPAILRSANSEFHAIASREEAKLAECRARFPGVQASYRGYEELLRDPAIDAVYIPLPNALHREWTIKAAEHGKHVLCEKPLALNAAECREMIAACVARGVLLMEAFMYRYNARTRMVREVLRSGALGEIRHLNASFRFLLANPASIKLKPELGGGALYDVGCYPVNFIGMVVDEIAAIARGGGTVQGGVRVPGGLQPARSAGSTGSEVADNPGADLPRPETVSVACERVGGIDVSFSALLKYSSGLIAAAHCGFNTHKRVFAEITGTAGVLEIPDPFFDNPGVLTLTTGETRRELPVEASDRYRGEVEDFADAILTRRAPQFGLAETLRNAEVLDRLLAASLP